MVRIPTVSMKPPSSRTAVWQPTADETLGVYPNIPATLAVEFAEVTDAAKQRIGWMEKFGDWKCATQVSDWQATGRATWTVDVAEPGDDRLDLVYKGEGRLVWNIATDEGVKLQNQQNSSPVYHAHPFGLLTFRTAGKHTLTVSLVAGPRDKASLEAIRLSPTE